MSRSPRKRKSGCSSTTATSTSPPALHDSEPEREVISEMRRDGQGTNDNESFGVVFDTFHDRRNGFLFQVSLAGGLFDGYITDERDMNRDWNTVWDARTARVSEGGWTVEMAIPFKSLRFPPGANRFGASTSSAS